MQGGFRAALHCCGIDRPKTSAAAWFTEADLPTDLSLRRVLPHQLRRMFAYARDPSLPTDFD